MKELTTACTNDNLNICEIHPRKNIDVAIVSAITISVYSVVPTMRSCGFVGRNSPLTLEQPIDYHRFQLMSSL
ncbi:MAG: hypothetical protein N3D12_06535 [Candidatus Methanomethyliaceae archaeon]|nr:hypothetical protein [Candidatus Methanomethyliaceae archaeon]